MPKPPFGPSRRVILYAALGVALTLPALATPPDSGATAALGQVARDGSSWLARGLRSAFILGLMPGACATPVLSNPSAFNLSSPDPISVLVAQGVNQALVLANATGGLPPMDQLKTLGGRNSSQGFAILATLPAYIPSTNASFLAPSSFSNLSLPGYVPISDDLYAALATFEGARLAEIYNLFESIGYQLLADAGLVYFDSPLVGALTFAGNQLLSIGYLVGAMSSQVAAEASQHVIESLLNATAADPAASDQSAGPVAAASMTPEAIYGTWQANTTVPRNGTLTYRFTRSDFTKVNVTVEADQGETVEAVLRPGAVVAMVHSRRGPSDPGAVPANVTVLVEKLNGQTLELHFGFPAPGAGNGTALSLVEQEGEGHAFLKIAND